MSPIYLPWMVKAYQWYCIGVLVLNHATHKEKLKRCSIFHLFYFFQEQRDLGTRGEIVCPSLFCWFYGLWCIRSCEMFDIFLIKAARKMKTIFASDKRVTKQIRSSQLLAAANRYRGGGRDNESINKWPLSRGNQSAVVDDELIQTCDLTWPSFNLLRTTWMSLDRPVPDELSFPTD